MTGLEARAVVEAAVRRELFGPGDDEPPAGKPIDCSSGSAHFETLEASRGQFHDATTGQELLTQSDPLRRYGIGVLYSGASQRGTRIAADAAASEDPDLTWVPGLSENEDNPMGQRWRSKACYVTTRPTPMTLI